MKRIIFFFILGIQFLFGQHKYADYVKTYIPNFHPVEDSAYLLSLNIDTPRLKEVLSFLASDSCQGRELGTPGNAIAAQYIASKLTEYKIPFLKDSSYFQKVDYKSVSWETNEMSIDDSNYREIWDFVNLSTENENLNFSSDSLIFLGYGIESPTYNDYSGIDLRNKAIIIYNGEPRNKKEISYLSHSSEPSIWSSLDQKLKAAKKHGVKLVLIVEEKFKELADKNRYTLYNPIIVNNTSTPKPYYVNAAFISSNMFAKILGNNQKKVIATREKIKKNGKPKYFILNTKIEVSQLKEEISVSGKNILAFIEGSDKKDEIVILSAHYDHIGMRGQDVFNGADDNGSGTSGLTQIARTLQMAKEKGMGPRRSVLCLFATGEEKGLLGSLYYVHNPVFPLEKTIVDVNIDMIGRTDSKYSTNGKYIYVIGSDRLSKDLHKENEKVNELYSHLTLDYTYNAEDDPNRYYYRSDHFNFAEKGIPAIFFFSGVHEDYHRITDDIEKIQFEKYKNVVRHVFLLAWELANSEIPIKKDEIK